VLELAAIIVPFMTAVPPTPTLPKSITAGDTEIPPPLPFPVSTTGSTSSEASLIIETVPIIDPIDLGEKFIPMVRF
jgi:hypothetical protein